MSAKWTLGELKQAVRIGDKSQMREILEYLTERGPSVIDWKDARQMCSVCDTLYELTAESRAPSDICKVCNEKSKPQFERVDVLSVPCPRELCEAKAGELCGLLSKAISHPHKERHIAAYDAWLEKDGKI